MAWIPRPAALFLSVFFLITSASAEDLPFVGLDVDGNLACDTTAGDMGRVYLPAEIGDSASFEVYFDTDDSVTIFGCIFCVKDRAGMEFLSWEYATPEDWDDVEIWDSDEQVREGKRFPVSEWIPGLFPDYKCWLVQSTDWSFQNPMTFPAPIGTFRFRVAEEGPIEWLIDGVESAYMSTEFLSHFFTEPEQTCGMDSPPEVPPSPPSACSATDSLSDSVVVTWVDASSDEAGFRIWRTGSLVGNVGPDAEVYVDRPPVGTYVYTIRAYSWAGESDACQDVGTRLPPGPPPAPTDCAATDDRSDAVVLTWQDNAENEIGYRILRSGNLIAQVDADIETYEDHPAYGTYLYAVYAYAMSGESGQCLDEGTRVLPPPPQPPDSCSATDDRSDSVIVAWRDNADNESGFRVKRDGAVVGTVGANVERYRDVPAFGTYLYEVLAYNPGGESPSCSDEGTRVEPPPPPPPPDPPSDCNATDDRTDSVIVTWQDNADDELGYRIKRDHALIATVGPDVEIFRDVPAVGTHAYAVRAFNDGGESDPCSDDGTRLPTVPDAPGSCAATDDRIREIVITWEDLSSDEVGFRVWRGDQLIGDLPAGAETCTDDDLPPGDYTYAVRAYNAGGLSDPCSDGGVALPGSVTFLVRPDGTGDAPTIQAAVESAFSGDIILLAPGVFTGEGNRGVDFLGKEITVRSQAGQPAAVVIDCGGADRGFAFQGGEGPGALLRAVTIRNGYHPTAGGGVYVAGSPTIQDCIFDHCATDGDGGAIAVVSGSPVVRGILFRQNSAARGGAVFSVGSSPTFDRCTFHGNSSTAGSGGTAFCGGGAAAAFGHVIVSTSSGGTAVACEASGAANFTCSDVFGNQGGDWTGCIAGQNGVDGNISLNPRFCSPPVGNFRLHVQSPCLAQPCGRMGAYGQGCWGNVVAEQVGKSQGADSTAAVIARPDGPPLELVPSPSRASVTIRYSLPERGPASIRIFDVAGRLVHAVDAPSSRGDLTWDGTDGSGAQVAPGVYFVRITAGGTVETKRVTLIR
jgi:hypothetical protein